MNPEFIMTRRESSTNALIISDDLENGRAWAYSLSMRGFHVRVMSVGLAQGGHYEVDNQAVVIVDENHTANSLPEVCRNIRAYFDGPLVVFTYSRDEQLLLQLYDDQVDECVCKPIGTSLFLAKVTAWLRRSESNVTPKTGRGGGDRSIDALRRLLSQSGNRDALFSPPESRPQDASLRNPRCILPPEYLVRQSLHKDDRKVRGSRRKPYFRLPRKDGDRHSRTFFIRTAAVKDFRFLRKQ